MKEDFSPFVPCGYSRAGGSKPDHRCGGASDGKTHLTFQIWDVAQRDGMQAMCDAYTEQHPDVVIEVQVTSWDEYWTKLEAATMAKQAPDIFWMHTNEILKYADNGKLPDCSAIVETEHFSDISLANASGSDGKLYAVPKDKDSVGLVYNKEMFDAAGVSYPTRPGPGTLCAKPPEDLRRHPAFMATWPMATTS